MSWAKIISCGEKAHYPFKHYPRKRCETVVFPGCSFSSQFPRTTDALAALCAERGAGMAYDCCGHTLEGFGEKKAAARVLSGIEERLAACGCKRLALVCPNCMAYLEGRISLPVVSVYELLGEWGIGAQTKCAAGMLYVPCPDKQSRRLEGQVRSLGGLEQARSCAKGCCGLMPAIAARGAEASQAAGRAVIAEAHGEPVYAYCASCAGQFARLGCSQVRHVLSLALGVDEAPDAAHAFFNRAKRKFG